MKVLASDGVSKRVRDLVVKDHLWRAGGAAREIDRGRVFQGWSRTIVSGFFRHRLHRFAQKNYAVWATSIDLKDMLKGGTVLLDSEDLLHRNRISKEN